MAQRREAAQPDRQPGNGTGQGQARQQAAVSARFLQRKLVNMVIVRSSFRSDDIRLRRAYIKMKLIITL